MFSQLLSKRPTHIVGFLFQPLAVETIFSPERNHFHLEQLHIQQQLRPCLKPTKAEKRALGCILLLISWWMINSLDVNPFKASASNSCFQDPITYESFKKLADTSFLTEVKASSYDYAYCRLHTLLHSVTECVSLGQLEKSHIFFCLLERLLDGEVI